MLLSEVLEQYVSVHLYDSPDHSIGIHRIGLAHFSAYLKTEPRTGHLTDAQVGGFVRWLIAKDLSRDTVRMYRNRLVALWRFCARRSLCGAWPELRPMKSLKKVPTALTMEQLRSIWKATFKFDGRFTGSIPAGDWWRAMIQFAWCTGERKTAILSIRRIDVRLVMATAVVRGSSRKGDVGDRLYHLSPECVDAFSKIWEPARDLVLPFPHCAQTFYSRLRDLLDVAGVPTSREYMTHIFRRSVATHLKIAGGDATEALDHSDSKVTNDSYIDPSLCPKGIPWKLLPRLDGGSGDKPAA